DCCCRLGALPPPRRRRCPSCRERAIAERPLSLPSNVSSPRLSDKGFPTSDQGDGLPACNNLPYTADGGGTEPRESQWRMPPMSQGRFRMSRRMGPWLVLLLSLSFVPSTPARAQMESPPPLDYVPVADPFKLPDGMNFGRVSGVAINSKGHIFVLHRGPSPLMEFDADGNFVRGLGEGLFDRAHGLRIDA